MPDKNINLLNREWFKKATLEDVQAEIKSGADVNTVDETGWTALMFAVQCRCETEIIKLLLDAGADVNVKDWNDMTPLMLATLCDGADVIDVLIKHGADIEAKDKDGNTALMYAYNNAVGIKKLIDYGANINVKNDLKDTLLDRVALKGKKPEVIKILLGFGMDINAKNTDFDDATPLMKAVMNNNDVEMIKALINAGADIHLKDKQGKSLMFYAQYNDNPEILKFVEKLGVK